MKVYKFWSYTRHLDTITRYVIAETEEEAKKFIDDSLLGTWVLAWEEDLTSPMLL